MSLDGIKVKFSCQMFSYRGSLKTSITFQIIRIYQCTVVNAASLNVLISALCQPAVIRFTAENRERL